MDMYILQNVFNMLCPECKQNNIQFVELGKQGCARNLMLECQCGWDHTFWSSEKVNNKLTKTKDPTVFRGFDINKRFFYAMRSCGQGFAGMDNDRYATTFNQK